MFKRMPKIANVSFFSIFRPLEASKLYKNILSFNLVGHMWKSIHSGMNILPLQVKMR